jgi:uncharacterized membrane protein YphA (DoxX/SURF4 family)
VETILCWEPCHELSNDDAVGESRKADQPADTAVRTLLQRLLFSSVAVSAGRAAVLGVIAGLASRLTAFLLADNMLVAYWTADHAALLSVFSDPGRFYGADPYTFLFASMLVLIFGAGYLSVDTVIAKRWRKRV